MRNQNTDPKDSFRAAMSLIRKTGTHFNGVGFQTVREVGFSQVLKAARRPVVDKPWDPSYFEALADQLGPTIAGRLIHAGVVHQ